MKYYVLFVYGQAEIESYGPYWTGKAMREMAMSLYRENGKEHGYFWASISPSMVLKVGDFASDFFEDE